MEARALAGVVADFLDDLVDGRPAADAEARLDLVLLTSAELRADDRPIAWLRPPGGLARYIAEVLDDLVAQTHQVDALLDWLEVRLGQVRDRVYRQSLPRSRGQVRYRARRVMLRCVACGRPAGDRARCVRCAGRHAAASRAARARARARRRPRLPFDEVAV